MAIDKRLVGAIQAVTGRSALRAGFASETLAGDVVLTDLSAQVLRLDPAAARNVDLPVGVDGLWYCIINVGAAAEDITVRRPAAGATVVTVTPADLAVVAYHDDDWQLVALVAGVVS